MILLDRRALTSSVGFMDPDAEIDHEGPVPVFRQMADILRTRIDRGDWQPNRPIPSEAQLVQTYGIARETVRKAIRVLVDDGMVFVVHGRGRACSSSVLV